MYKNLKQIVADLKFARNQIGRSQCGCDLDLMTSVNILPLWDLLRY